jgi:hypothetical protein
MPASHSAHNLAAMLPAVAEPSMFASQQFQYSQVQSVSSPSSESPETISGSTSATPAFHPTSAFGAGAMHPGSLNGTSLGGALHGLSAGDPASFTGSAAPTNANANIADLLMRVVGALGSIESRLARVESGTRLLRQCSPVIAAKNSEYRQSACVCNQPTDIFTH